MQEGGGRLGSYALELLVYHENWTRFPRTFCVSLTPSRGCWDMIDELPIDPPLVTTVGFFGEGLLALLLLHFILKFYLF